MPFIGIPKPKPKKRGTVLTDYDIERKQQRDKLETLSARKGRGFTDIDVEEKAERFSRTITPTLLADESAITKKKRKKISSDRLRSGRLSTILDDTLG